MINRNLLDKLNRLGFGCDADYFENYVYSLQESISNGKIAESYDKYREYIEILKELKPDSKLLLRGINDNESNSEYEVYYDKDSIYNKERLYDEESELIRNNIISNIPDAKSMADLEELQNKIGDDTIDLIASTKVDGIPVKIVYKNGKLLSVNIIDNGKVGREITYSVMRAQAISNEVSEFNEYETVELRGDIVIDNNRYDELKEVCKDKISGLNYMLNKDIPDGELYGMLIICYRCKIKSTYEKDKSNEFRTLEDELDFLRSCGLDIPDYELFKSVDCYGFSDSIQEIIETFEEKFENEELIHDSDGIVVSINENADVSFALKMGKIWEKRNTYDTEVRSIDWIYTNTYVKPKIMIEDIVTVTGETINSVELDSIDDLLRSGIKVGTRIKVEYNGKDGVRLKDVSE